MVYLLSLHFLVQDTEIHIYLFWFIYFLFSDRVAESI